MAGRKIVLDEAPGAPGQQSAADGSINETTWEAAPADDVYNKISDGLPAWTLLPPAIPLKRLVRKR